MSLLNQQRGIYEHGEVVTAWPVHGLLIPLHGGLVPIHGSASGSYIENGDGSSVVGWVNSAHGVLSAVGGRLRITNSTGAGVGYSTRVLGTRAGELYELTGEAYAGTAIPRIIAGTSVAAGVPSGTLVVNTGNIADGQFKVQFTALTPDTFLGLTANSAALNTFAEFDNLYVRHIIR